MKTPGTGSGQVAGRGDDAVHRKVTVDPHLYQHQCYFFFKKMDEALMVRRFKPFWTTSCDREKPNGPGPNFLGFPFNFLEGMLQIIVGVKRERVVCVCVHLMNL